ncbi:MAG TPA: hypothetical protein VGK36_08795 [Candidatus Angelobacter sp.]|jgi:hypothetical protein
MVLTNLRKRLRGLWLLLAVFCATALPAQTKPNINLYTSGNLLPSRIQPGVAGECLTTDVLGNTAWGSCGSGSGSSGVFPQTFAAASHQWLNGYNATNGLFTHGAALSTDLADFSAAAPSTAGKIPIYDPTATNSAGGTGAYVPGDPLVQGLFADTSTSAENPVAIGGYDTAGTPALHRGTFINGTPGGSEYGFITRNIPSGTQPISGSVSVLNFPATQPISGTVAATQSGTWTVQPGNTANTTAWKVDGSATTQPVSGSVSVSNFPGTQPVSGTVTANAAQSGTWTVQPGNTANTTAWKVDGSAVTQPVSGTVTANAGTGTFAVQGAKSENAAAPSTTNVGTLPAVANAALPTKTEGNQVALSMDLAGNLRVYGHPPNVLGCYMVNGRTSTYTGLSAATPLFSYRWGSSTALAVIMRVRVMVATTGTSTTNSGQVERELIVARSFTASDTGGTAVTLTGNNQKMRTSQATSLVTDMRFGTTITAGTRTLDANPIASAVAWLAPNFTGMDIGGSGASATAAGWTSIGGNWVDLLNATNGQMYPLVFAQNEGFIVRVGKDAMPTGFTQQTYLETDWCEVSAY